MTDVERFGGIDVQTSPHLLAPRPWTLLQSDWAVDLVEVAPPGEVVELCTGTGHIGLEVTRRTGRPTMLVDADPGACNAAARNAERNGLAHLVRVRCADVATALRPDDHPALVLADPPYVRRDQIGRFPDDPAHAIDGGPDGLDVAREVVQAVQRPLAAGAPVLLQLHGSGQAVQLQAWLTSRRDLEVRIAEVRAPAPDRCVALLRSTR